MIKNVANVQLTSILILITEEPLKIVIMTHELYWTWSIFHLGVEVVIVGFMIALGRICMIGMS